MWLSASLPGGQTRGTAGRTPREAAAEDGGHRLGLPSMTGGRRWAMLPPMITSMEASVDQRRALVAPTDEAGVEIDTRAHRARVRAGARWADVAHPTSYLGLAPAAGFDRLAGVVDTVLGDGMGWLGRRHGVAAASVTAVEFVTPEGELTRGDDLEEAAGGVITTLEIDLHQADDLYAGALFFSFDRAAEVLQAWRAWTEQAPPEITSIGRLMQFGDGFEVADLVRGRSLVVIEAAHLGTEAEGAELLRPLREL